MRTVMVLAATLAVVGCGPSPEEKRAEADAKAANFRPPSVTSRLDYGSMAQRRFRTLDRNADDRLDTTELPRADSRLRELDRNRDGEITATEFSEGMLARFDAMDLNRDGTVTTEERDTYRNRPAPTPTTPNSAPQLP